MESNESALTRREPRSPASGELLLEVAGELVRGQLLDVSPHGFAIRHEYEKFSPGQQVTVLYQWGKIPARLVWLGEREGGKTAGFRTD